MESLLALFVLLGMGLCIGIAIIVAIYLINLED
jgi:hypothetical protein